MARMTVVWVVLLSCATSACGSARPVPPAPTSTTKPPPGATTTTTTPRSANERHIMVVMMENKDSAAVIGQADQPYTNGLARQYGLATQSYGFGHPSLPNYLVMVSGSNQGVTDDGPPSAHRFPGVATLADQLAAAGLSAKAYAENLPADPANDAGEYAVRHFPWEYFPSAKIALADASSLIPDLEVPHPPDFVWYTPNLIDDEHDGTVEDGDRFLSKLIPQVQSTAWYRAGGEIIIEWDEAEGDSSGIHGSGGGHIPTIVVSAALASSPQLDSTPVDTAGILGSIEDVFGLAHLGGASSAGGGNIDSLLNASG